MYFFAVSDQKIGLMAVRAALLLPYAIAEPTTGKSNDSGCGIFLQFSDTRALPAQGSAIYENL